MRLIPFVSTDKFRKASEQSLPPDERRQAIAYVEDKLGRSLTDAERARFVQVAKLAPKMVPGDIIGDDPIELRPVKAPATADLAQGGEVTLGYSWTISDWLAYLAPWAGIGFIIGAVIVALIWRNS